MLQGVSLLGERQYEEALDVFMEGLGIATRQRLGERVLSTFHDHVAHTILQLRQQRALHIYTLVCLPPSHTPRCRRVSALYTPDPMLMKGELIECSDAHHQTCLATEYVVRQCFPVDLSLALPWTQHQPLLKRTTCTDGHFLGGLFIQTCSPER